LIHRDWMQEGTQWRPRPGQSVIFAAWEDGTIIWSGDQIGGGPPLFKATLSKEKRTRLMAELKGLATQAKSLPCRRWAGHDAAHTVIRYRDSADDIRLTSWHETSETESHLVASSRGIEALYGRKREDVLAASTEPYRRFRSVWQEIRVTIHHVLPASGDEVNPSSFDLNGE
jgi:hypothetical protein